MIRHICMFKLKEEADGHSKSENIIRTLKLAEIISDLPTVTKFEIVSNSPEAPQSNYDICLIADFADIAALDEYQVHPKHVEFGNFIKEVRSDRACVDYEF